MWYYKQAFFSAFQSFCLTHILYIANIQDGTQHKLTDPGSGGTVEQNRYFLDCVKTNTPVSLPAANLDEAVKTMQLAADILGEVK